jgi:hypothetical protein
MIGVEVGRSRVMVGMGWRGDVGVRRAVLVGRTVVGVTTTPDTGVFVLMGKERVEV